MTETRSERAILLVDITGSTTLYETVGDDEAARRIGSCIDWMRTVVDEHGGTFIAAKGDDVLVTFESADAALAAEQAILDKLPTGGLSVHAGLHHGGVISMRGDIFGDAVNVTARLTAMANRGEVLISREFAGQLSAQEASALRPLDPITFKGKSAPTEVLSLNEGTQYITSGNTLAEAVAVASARVSVALDVEDRHVVVEEGASISLGRAEDNAVILLRPWISRHHAKIAVSNGRVQFTDRSTYGSFLLIGDAHEMVVRRESVVLIGSGRMSLGMSLASPEALVAAFEVSAK
jgi:adenylate cyclase